MGLWEVVGSSPNEDQKEKKKTIIYSKRGFVKEKKIICSIGKGLGWDYRGFLVQVPVWAKKENRV